MEIAIRRLETHREVAYASQPGDDGRPEIRRRTGVANEKHVGAEPVPEIGGDLRYRRAPALLLPLQKELERGDRPFLLGSDPLKSSK